MLLFIENCYSRSQQSVLNLIVLKNLNLTLLIVRSRSC